MCINDAAHSSPNTADVMFANVNNRDLCYETISWFAETQPIRVMAVTDTDIVKQ